MENAFPWLLGGDLQVKSLRRAQTFTVRRNPSLIALFLCYHDVQ